MKKIVIISYTDYPQKSAGALRAHTFACLLKAIGYNPLVICMGRGGNNSKVQEFDGIHFISFRRKGENIFKKLNNYFLFTKRCINQIKKIGNIDTIWVVSVPLFLFFYLKAYSRIKKIQLCHDSVEWYSPQEFKLGVFSISFLTNDIKNRFIVSKQVKVISISSYLLHYYLSKGIKSIKIPVIFEMNKVQFISRLENNKLQLIYAGSPGNKDNLVIILEGLALLSIDKLNRIEVSIYGITKDRFFEKFSFSQNNWEKIKQNVTFFGRRSREEVLKALMHSDFSLLLRFPDLRYAKAGFPTKVVESLSCGVPCITNFSSDLHEYLRDEENSLIVDYCNSLSFYKTLCHALTLDSNKLELMRVSARETAVKYFDAITYKEKLTEFLKY